MFHGEGVAGLSVDERLTIANMTTEWGTLVGMFPFDEVLREYLLARAAYLAGRKGEAARYTREDVERWWAERDRSAPDADAHYSKVLELDLGSVSPHVSGPNSVKVMRSVHEVEGERVAINKAYLMSCVNARLSDLEAAAKVVGDRRVAPGVEFYVAAASSDVQAQAEASGAWGRLMAAGAIALPAGCGACIGLGAGTLEPGEVGISSTNRNFQGRMGSRDALCYLASPAVVAESAARGYIASPADFEARTRGSCRVIDRAEADPGEQEIIEGFPQKVAGRVLYLPLDNLNTDGIYGKDVTYRDDITLEQQGQYAMLNYDPAFQSIAREGDIIVGGRNFGTGSSREQAATALASRGVRLVIAASASQTYSRNAYNNGFIILECPALADALAARFAGEAKSGTRTIPGPDIEIDFTRGRITMEGKPFRFPALSPTAQELVVAGGSENVVRRRLTARV